LLWNGSAELKIRTRYELCDGKKEEKKKKEDEIDLKFKEVPKRKINRRINKLKKLRTGQFQ